MSCRPGSASLAALRGSAATALALGRISTRRQALIGRSLVTMAQDSTNQPVDVEVVHAAVSSTDSGLKVNSEEQHFLKQMETYVRGFEKIADAWESLSADAPQSAVEELGAQVHAVRKELEACPYGDPTATTTVTRHFCRDPVVKAHGDTTKACILAELAQLKWELRRTSAIGANARERATEQTTVYVSMALLRLRLRDLEGAQQDIEKAVALGGSDPRQGVLSRYCAQLAAPRSDKTLNAEYTSGGHTEATLQQLRRVFLSAEYTSEEILRVTGAGSLSDFIFLDQRADELERHLLNAAAEPNPMRPEENERKVVQAALVDLIRIFLLHRVLPLARFVQILGVDATKLLLSIEAISAVKGEYCATVSAEQAVEAVAVDPRGCRALYAFANIAVWPLEADLLIATDYEQTFADQDMEPVMYVSEDTLALKNAAPRGKVQRLLDVCCGSGVQGIVALRHYAAEATFADVNPRAIRFTKFNLALNALSQQCSGVFEGEAYDALPRDTPPFDVILANPPFVPNPEGIASGAGALFGNGGAFGDDVLSAVVAGASRYLRLGGHLAGVAMAAEVDTLPSRVEDWYKASTDPVFTGMIFYGPPTPAAQYLPTSSEVETLRYSSALERQGVTSLSEVVMVLLNGISPEPGQPPVSLCGEPRENLWSDDMFLRLVVQRTVPDPADFQDLEVSSPVQPIRGSATNAAGRGGQQVPLTNPLREGRLIGFQAGFFAAHCNEPSPEWASVAEELRRVQATSR